MEGNFQGTTCVDPHQQSAPHNSYLLSMIMASLNYPFSRKLVLKNSTYQPPFYIEQKILWRDTKPGFDFCYCPFWDAPIEFHLTFNFYWSNHIAFPIP